MSHCPECNSTNRAGARFCDACGAPLPRACPHCGNAVREAARFCDICGQSLPPAPLLAPAPFPASEAGEGTRRGEILHQYLPKELLAKLESARRSGGMVGERRVVTILFCDLQGSTAAAEGLDPEDWTEIINGAFEFMIRPVYKYEGTVARLMGDAILAFFGAPIAHEDDPQRAVLAGLDIVAGIGPFREQTRARWGVEFDVRVGINTGTVVVGAVGSDLRMEYTALGDAVNLAARMEQTAQPGSVQIAHDTYKLVRRQFEVEELGGVQVKGKFQSVPAYRVLALTSPTAGRRGIEGLHAEVVGRDEELATLRAVIGDVRQGVGRLVCLLGEAGLGKSRLIAELRRMVGGDGAPPPVGDLRPDDIQWYEAVSLSYETAQPYALFQRLIRRMAGVTHADAPPAVREKLAALIERLPEAQRPQAAGVFGALFGLGSDEKLAAAQALEGEAFKRELFAVMPACWQARFAGCPTALVFDDVHWSDSASVALLKSLFPLVEQMPLVLAFALRPDRDAPGWRLRTTADEEYHHRYTEVLLRPLTEGECWELVNRLLSLADLPDELRARILERAAGNPFYMEEVVRTLIDRGAVVAEGDLARAVGAADDNLATLDRYGLSTFRPEALRLKARAFAAAGRSDEAQAALQEARTLAEPMSAGWVLWRILGDMTEVEAARGREAAAADLRREARAYVDYIAGHVAEADLRASFLSLPEVRRLHSRS